MATDLGSAVDMIASGRTLASVLAFLAATIEHHEDAALVAIHVASEDGSALTQMAAPSLPEPVRNALAVVEPAGAQTLEDAAMGEDGPLPHVALAAGLHVRLAQPILSPESGLLGAVTVYGPEPAELRHPNAARVAVALAALAIERDRARTAEARLRRHADRDLLTGLRNRAHLVRGLDRAVASGRHAAVLLVDVDEFGALNDDVGHEVADAALVVVARRLVASAGPGQSVARVSGDRFAVLAEGPAAQDDLEATAQRFFEALARPVPAGGRRLRISSSAGVAGVDAGDRARGEDLLRYGEAALERARSRGGGRVEVLGAQARRRLRERIELEHALRDAIETGDLELAYQPIVSLDDGRVSHVEALVRWTRADGERVSPATFVPVAEESGLIRRLGRWVLEAACRQMTEWAGEPPPAVAVNVSARQIVDPEFPALVSEVLERHGLSPGRLVLEVTETALLEATETTTAVMRSLAELGVRLVLDDFGDGFSSLAHLRWFPVHGLKIDRSLIADLGERPEAAPLVEAVVAMARAVGVTVVAEGVETAEQLEAVRRAGCQMAQGYALGRPAPAAALTRR